MKGGGRRKTINSDLPPPNRLRNEINDQGVDLQVEYDNQKPEREQQQHISDADDGGNEYGEDEDENYEEDQSDDVGIHGAAADAGESKGDDERPKLAEGFYEIEALRKKRVRKGETQYLIKWRGWPEAANTWEPVENLLSCPDVIDAFEERIRSKKQRSNRKRKRKNSVAPTSQLKKKQKEQPQQCSSDATYDIPSVTIKIIEEPLAVPSVNNSNSSHGTEMNVGGTSTSGAANQSNEAGSIMVSPQIGERKEGNELDVKLGELMVPSSTNQENMSDFAIHIQEDRAPEGVSPIEVRPENGTSKVDGTEPTRVGAHIGARRRKSGTVKRFKPEPNPTPKNTIGDLVVQDGAMNTVNGLDSNNVIDTPRSVCSITKIVKPVNYSTSILNDTEEVSVSFLARRADGEEVIVDNKYLKENNPLLLINFYEQHLRYNSPSE